MKKTYLILVLIVLALIEGCAQTSTQTSSENQQTTEEPPQQETANTPSIDTDIIIQSTDRIIEITSSGFNPVTLTINVGDTVTFINKDTQSHWVASAVHPTHLAYPETGGCIGSKFDSCHGLIQDESFSFKFNNKGSWKYHDHLRPGLTGTIVVK